MKEVAGILCKEDDEALFSRIQNEIAAELRTVMYDPVNKTFGSQTADAMALDLGIVPEGDETDVSRSIVENMNTHSEGFMNCGIFGISRIGSMLARHGNAEAAWRMFTKKGEHSFEWMWTAANATTLWESLPINEISRKGALSASYNHPMQAGFDITFFEDIAGIAPDPSGFGFKVIRFEPLFCDFLPWAKAQIQTPFGTVSSNWEKTGGTLKWEISIPPNSSGLVIPPHGGKCTVNGEEIELCTFLKTEKTGDKNRYTFPSGSYQLVFQDQ
jgi:alpha-L-rhamnosidase